MTWSGVRKRLEEDLLAECLRGRIQYFCTSYSKYFDHNGRVAVRFDGREIFKSDYSDFYAGYDMHDIKLRKFKGNKRWKMAYNAALHDGHFDQKCFYSAYREFNIHSISESLNSENAIVRMLAILDRRVGKRQLLKLVDKVDKEPEWLRQFYIIRLEGEGIRL
ncbi:MAG: hypothetical protein HDT42_04945 [Ruminococcaceae bacterium]|nr:hypothetical protein [Oscillospiraceae bacterium]